MGQPATFQIHKFAKSRLPSNPAHIRTVESCRRTNLLPFSSILQLREARTPFTPSAILKTGCARAHNIRWAATKPWRRNGGQLHQGPEGLQSDFVGVAPSCFIYSLEVPKWNRTWHNEKHKTAYWPPSTFKTLKDVQVSFKGKRIGKMIAASRKQRVNFFGVFIISIVRVFWRGI